MVKVPSAVNFQNNETYGIRTTGQVPIKKVIAAHRNVTIGIVSSNFKLPSRPTFTLLVCASVFQKSNLLTPHSFQVHLPVSNTKFNLILYSYSPSNFKYAPTLPAPLSL